MSYQSPSSADPYPGGSATPKPATPPTQQAYNNAHGATQTYYAPQLTALDQQNVLLGGQINNQNAMHGLSQQELNADYGYKMAANNLAKQALGVDRGYYNKQFGFADREFGLEHTDAWKQAERRLQQLEGHHAMSGSHGTPGLVRDKKFNEHMLRDQVGRAELGKDRDYARIQHALTRLDNDAAKLGLDGKQYGQMLSIGLQKLGLSNTIDVTELMIAMEGNNAAQAQLLIDAALQAGQLAAQTGPGPQADTLHNMMQISGTNNTPSHGEQAINDLYGQLLGG